MEDRVYDFGGRVYRVRLVLRDIQLRTTAAVGQSGQRRGQERERRLGDCENCHGNAPLTSQRASCFLLLLSGPSSAYFLYFVLRSSATLPFNATVSPHGSQLLAFSASSHLAPLYDSTVHRRTFALSFDEWPLTNTKHGHRKTLDGKPDASKTIGTRGHIYSKKEGYSNELHSDLSQRQWIAWTISCFLRRARSRTFAVCPLLVCQVK